jgi:predicted nucleic acid-binding protein
VKLLVDTGALLAFLLKSDQHHRQAVEFVRAHPNVRFVLSSLILNEVVTRLRARADAPRAADTGRKLLESRRYSVVFVDAPLVQRGLDRLEQFADKRLSLTDCVSFELIDRLGLQGAFAFDRDFRDCGYLMVP